MSSNYSVYSLPAFWFLSLVPHSYAIGLITRATNGGWANNNPRSSNFTDSLKKRVPAETYATFERAKAAHVNSIESLPLFAAAVILGNMARLPNDTLNTASLVFLVSRALYTLLYVGVSSRKYSYARTLVWLFSIATCMVLLLKAAREFREGRISG